MPLAETGKAISEVSTLLKNLLTATTGVDVHIGRPEPPSVTTTKRLNLFLYEIHFDESLKNFSLDDGQPAPLWLVLHYLLTAFESGESDTAEAHELLGQGLQALCGFNFRPRAPVPPPLEDNPDLLKLTFDETGSELLARLMQGPDDRYRCSVGFQVRPVLIAPAEPPAYSLLVGVDYTSTPPTVIGEDGVHNLVLPSMGPVITAVTPDRFDVGDSVTLTGTDLGSPDLSVTLGPIELPATAQRPDRLTFALPATLNAGTTISAGSHPVAVVQTLASGRRRSSNLLVGGLRPRLTGAIATGLTRVHPLDPSSSVFGMLELNGFLLGTAADDVFVALYADGHVVRAFDVVTPVAPPQTKLQVTIDTDHAVPPATYRVILRVNGQQAIGSPAVSWIV